SHARGGHRASEGGVVGRIGCDDGRPLRPAGEGRRDQSHPRRAEVEEERLSGDRNCQNPVIAKIGERCPHAAMPGSLGNYPSELWLKLVWFEFVSYAYDLAHDASVAGRVRIRGSSSSPYLLERCPCPWPVRADPVHACAWLASRGGNH